MTTKLICAGYGGQGALVVGLVLANAAMQLGKEVLWLSSYGGEMRGGAANCSVTISDKEIGSPYVTKMDILLAMNQVTVQKFEDKVNPGGTMIVNKSLMLQAHTYRTDIKVVEVEANDIALELGNPRGVNMVLLGALAQWTDLMGKDELATAMELYFLEKGKVNPKNMECFYRGANESKRVEEQIQ